MVIEPKVGERAGNGAGEGHEAGLQVGGADADPALVEALVGAEERLSPNAVFGTEIRCRSRVSADCCCQQSAPTP